MLTYLLDHILKNERLLFKMFNRLAHEWWCGGVAQSSYLTELSTKKCRPVTVCGQTSGERTSFLPVPSNPQQATAASYNVITCDIYFLARRLARKFLCTAVAFSTTASRSFSAAALCATSMDFRKSAIQPSPLALAFDGGGAVCIM